MTASDRGKATGAVRRPRPQMREAMRMPITPAAVATPVAIQSFDVGRLEHRHAAVDGRLEPVSKRCVTPGNCSSPATAASNVRM